MKIKSLTDIDAIRQYLVRIGAEARSLKTAVVRENFGKYWKDVSVIRFERDGTVKSTTIEHAPDDREREAIAEQIKGVVWPEIKPLASIVNPPKAIREADAGDVFEFRNLEGKIVMLQLRVETKGEKSYRPWTYWDDDEWRNCEPDGPLPIYNAHLLKDASTVFIHEGAKAARHVQWMVDGASPKAKEALARHPWGEELSAAVHLGWIGGALSPYRTDWKAVQTEGIKRAYIVGDNDEPGRAAIPEIAEKLRIPTFAIQFTDEFPASFDLADPFPKHLFGGGDPAGFYKGPVFRDCLHPATWATDRDVIIGDNGKPKVVTTLRDSFRSMWAYVEESDLFVCREMPEIMRQEPILNKMLAPFSHVKETSTLIVKAYAGRSARVCYRPDNPGLTVTYLGSSAINLHVPSTIRSRAGDVAPWEEFMKYLFPSERERVEMKKWIATLIARPDVRMNYGVLLVSERQGIGKSTLASHIIAPLLGTHNVSYPGEQDIASPFNEWLANKRLAIIAEIYSGSTWKAYHTLKSIITDTDITVNQKYMRQYKIDNWCHILASSNSLRALKMENDDRRWFYPELAETPWSANKFNTLRTWIEGGGLSIVKYWAETFGEYVAPSDRAPMTTRKMELIDGSRSEAQREAVALAEAIANYGQPAAVVLKDVVGWCRQSAQGKVFDSDYEIKKAMMDVGLVSLKRRLKIGPRMEYVIMNRQLHETLNEDEGESSKIVRSALLRCGQIMETPL